ncbi:MAG: hypothetical protein DCO96_10085 [Fluviicola sp. XM-24bin1]|nr:MAG: hypothetical protein DCO96_10085 [Fluviicola sp. XM-24bin1]
MISNASHLLGAFFCSHRLSTALCKPETVRDTRNLIQVIVAKKRAQILRIYRYLLATFERRNHYSLKITELEINSDKSPLGIDIDKVAKYYGNRRTVVQAFLKDKSRTPKVITQSQLNVFELIELQLGYPIPTKTRKIVRNM